MNLASRTVVYGLALGSAFVFSVALVPLFRAAALKLDIVDKPGGRKEHGTVTPLLGGVGVFLACAAATVLMAAVLEGREIDWIDGDLAALTPAFIGSTILFLTGLLDDVIKRRRELAYYYKLMGQTAAIALAMLVVARPQLDPILAGEGAFVDYVYLLLFFLWLLTTINSFNFSDNINGLMGGLAVIGILSSIVYIEEIDSLFIVMGFVFVGGILGFLPFNFPRARIFIGDAGSMFVGFWAGIFAWPLSEGFLATPPGGETRVFYGLDFLLPPFLMLGVPLYDACFVLVRRVVEGRPIYLGDNKHLSHRLVRAGLSVTEAALFLWGAGLILCGVGAIAYSDQVVTRILAFLLGVTFLISLTSVILNAEKKTLERRRPR